MPDLPASALKVQAALEAAGCDSKVVQMPSSTHTAQEAALACGCEVGQIVKSLVFVLDPPGDPVLLLVSGANRVNEAAVGARLGGLLRKADAERVARVSGFAIGGVPPLGHAAPLAVYIDGDLLAYPLVWAAAGTPHCVFPIQPQELVRITAAPVLVMT